MKKMELDRTAAAIRTFEELPTLHADAEWEQQLLARTKAAACGRPYSRGLLRLMTLLVLLVALNSLLFLQAANNRSAQGRERTETLETISDQLLIISSN